MHWTKERPGSRAGDAECHDEEGGRAAPLVRAVTKEGEAFRDATWTRTVEHRPGAEPAGIEVKVKIQLASGRAVCKLLDERGALRWQEDFGPGKRSRGAQLPGETGVFRLELGFVHATGSCTIRLADL